MRKSISEDDIIVFNTNKQLENAFPNNNTSKSKTKHKLNSIIAKPNEMHDRKPHTRIKTNQT